MEKRTCKATGLVFDVPEGWERGYHPLVWAQMLRFRDKHALVNSYGRSAYDKACREIRKSSTPWSEEAAIAYITEQVSWAIAHAEKQIGPNGEWKP